MKTVRRLLYRDIVSSVVFVAVAFLSLFFFIDLVDELQDVGKNGYQAWHAVVSSLMKVPSQSYELLPIAVLIGTIFSLSRLAQSSEYTILRTGGLGPGRALQLLAVLGISFGVLTFLIGDYLSPASERAAVLVRARLTGQVALGGAGAWLKDRQHTPDGERSYSVNVEHGAPNGQLEGVHIFEFDADGRLLTRTTARSGRVGDDAIWQLDDAVVTHWPAPDTTEAEPRIVEEHLPNQRWNSSLTASVVTAALLPSNSMSTAELWRYVSHLRDQEQAVQRFSIQFWRKAMYPFACVVMVALALPFAYLNARSGGISLKVFGGILLGIGFVLLNNVAGHLGLLHGWTPWLVAGVPSALFLLLSLGAFAWLVRYR
jgi:lipopolysaccharide export system permease protein